MDNLSYPQFWCHFWHFLEENLSLPGFENAKGLTSIQLRTRIADHVRLERRKIKMSQSDFSAHCEIPLRTYKRFELGKCDSLEAFLRIVLAFEKITGFERVIGLGLLFPPNTTTAMSKTPTAALDRLLKKTGQA